MSMRLSRRCWRRGLLVSSLLAVVSGCSTLTTPRPMAIASSQVSTATFSYDLATSRQREAALDRTWHIVNDRFYDPQFNGVNWEAVRLRYLPQLERVASDDAFYALLARMVGELSDSHTRVHNARDYRNRLDSVISTYGLRVADIDGKVAIVQVIPETDAARAGLRKGMVIDTIDGEKAIERLAKLRADIPADATTPERRLRSVIGRLLSSRAESLALEIENATGKTKVQLKRNDREIPLVVSSETLAGNIGYIAFNRFRPETAADFGRALGALRQTDGLIIDLRGNPGGSLGSMLAIARNFFPETRHVMTRKLRPTDGSSPESDGFGIARTPAPEMKILAAANAYTQPIAILLDTYSASSSELLATILREQRGATIVGRPTCGCVVAVRPNGYKLPGGGAIFVSESGFVSPYGTRMEGVPMTPDRAVAVTLTDLDAGVDRDLVVAREWLQQRPMREAEAPLH